MMMNLNDPEEENDDRPYYFTLDRQYNVRGVVDRAGSLREVYRYDEYGRLLNRESRGRGDMDNDGDMETAGGSIDLTRFNAAASSFIWDPRADIDDDGDIDATDNTRRISSAAAWYPAVSPTVAQAFSDVGNPFGWQGRVHFALDTADSATDGKLMLIDHRLRMHDPVIGRWLTRDPIGYVGETFNLYEYLESNPIEYMDPLGLVPPVVHVNWDGSYHVNYYRGNTFVRTIYYNHLGEPLTNRADLGGQPIDDFTVQQQYLKGFTAEELNQFKSDVQQAINNTADAAYQELYDKYHAALNPIDATGEFISEAIDTADLLFDTMMDPSQPWHQRLAAAQLLALTALSAGEVGLAAKGMLGSALKAGCPDINNIVAIAEAKACFPAGTLIVMADGSLKPIEEIESGDLVLCDFDPQTLDEVDVGVVLKTFETQTHSLIDLEFEAESEEFTITTTLEPIPKPFGVFSV